MEAGHEYGRWQGVERKKRVGMYLRRRIQRYTVKKNCEFRKSSELNGRIFVLRGWLVPGE